MLGRGNSEPMMRHLSPRELMLRRDRLIVLAGLTGIAALAWVYILSVARSMSGMDMGSMPMGMDMSIDPGLCHR
jgi:predicted metal-binding membrane protein